MCERIQKNTWFHILLAKNKFFLFLHYYQSPATPSQQMMVQSWSSYPGLWKFKTMPEDVLKNHYLTTWFSLTYINVYNFSFHYCNRYRQLQYIYHLIFLTMLDPWIQLPFDDHTIDMIGNCLLTGKQSFIKTLQPPCFVNQIEYPLHDPLWQFLLSTVASILKS